MKFSRHASANWKGSGMEGSGTITTQSKTLDRIPLTFQTRFADGHGTNPEELISAGLAGCFSMRFAFGLKEKGFTADNIQVTAKLTFDNGAITIINLDLEASIPDLSEQEFALISANAKEACPVSQLLRCTIILSTTLNNAA